MSNPAAALEKYSNVYAELKQHQKDNQSVFTAHQNIVLRLIDAENELRDAVAEAGAGISNADHVVTHTPQTQTWADIEVLDRMVADGKLNADLYKEIVKTQNRPPRITVGEAPKAQVT